VKVESSCLEAKVERGSEKTTSKRQQMRRKNKTKKEEGKIRGYVWLRSFGPGRG